MLEADVEEVSEALEETDALVDPLGTEEDVEELEMETGVLDPELLIKAEELDEVPTEEEISLATDDEVLVCVACGCVYVDEGVMNTEDDVLKGRLETYASASKAALA